MVTNGSGLVVAYKEDTVEYGPPCKNRTCDLRLRRPTLYPTELRAVMLAITYQWVFNDLALSVLLNFAPQACFLNECESSDNSGKVEGVINSIMVGHRMLNISRGPIEKWNRPAATLNFLVDENIDMSALEETMSLEFRFNLVNGDFVINEIISSTMPASNNGSSSND